MVANAGICFARSMLDSKFLFVHRSAITIVKVFHIATVEEWDRIFRINSRCVFLSYKYAALQMIRQGRGGRIIGASSGAGKEGGFERR